jgi:hypothetical protein
MKTGKNVARIIKIILGASPIPNQRISIGITDIGGICLKNSSVGSNCTNKDGNQEHRSASERANSEERPNPLMIRSRLAQTCIWSSPLWIESRNESTTLPGEGRRKGFHHPAFEPTQTKIKLSAM